MSCNPFIPDLLAKGVWVKLFNNKMQFGIVFNVLQQQQQQQQLGDIWNGNIEISSKGER